MKKIVKLLIALLIIVPIKVSAVVNGETPELKIFSDEASCLKELTDNQNDNSSVGTGAHYFLTCIKVTCDSGTVKHDDLNKLWDKVTCTNGNKTPYWEDLDSILWNDFEKGASCTSELEDTWITLRKRFNCGLLPTGAAYDPTGDTGNTTTTTTTTTQAQPNNNENNGTEPNPQTGIETYYTVLTGSIVVLGAGLYIINKKNLFKKI